jgi:AmmeMemoRadiSam system protein B
MLPAGWYPQSSGEISSFLSGFNTGGALAAIAPHAGWYYSGRTAALAVSSLDISSHTIIVIGGHLPAGAKVLMAIEDAVKTPLGSIPVNTQLRDLLFTEFNAQGDRYCDNTVEVLLPMVRFFFPRAHIVWMRLPAQTGSYTAGKTIAGYVKNLDYRVSMLASADLTHYGANYNFLPRGTGIQALKWVKEVNDARFIEALKQGKPDTVIQRAYDEKSCCSAGAVAGVMGFSRARGADTVELLEYNTSAAQSIALPESFVSYAAISFTTGKPARSL